ncbi:hypothetical protein NDU88_002941 [Pleurodeles waltl]|uniref:Uncharacterized protein n=1 Tax=Pleurodeles waltl TaxID=8319 RepID=A0AAV7SEM8_PLEWA|nr:hypothetical protein NDU88_002941 [Pleurodeles waltl]
MKYDEHGHQPTKELRERQQAIDVACGWGSGYCDSIVGSVRGFARRQRLLSVRARSGNRMAVNGGGRPLMKKVDGVV